METFSFQEQERESGPMDSKSGSMKLLLALVAVVLVAGAGFCRADDDPDLNTAGQLPGLAQPDTVHTNLWLTKALMGEIVTHAVSSMPPDPASVLLVNDGSKQMDELFGSVATGILRDRGYDLFVAAGDSTGQVQVDFIFSFKVMGVELVYPEVGRTLGIWQRWVARDVAVTASVQVSTAANGQLLFKDIVERRFSDRIDNDDFEDVESDLYNFTTAETAGSGWQNRMEEIVVLGTLVGLIAIYFANTGN